MIGPGDVGGTCPSPTDLWKNQCCCEADCCWDQCELSSPPTNCLQEVPNSKWIFNKNLGYHQAFKLISGNLYTLGEFNSKIFGISKKR